MVKAPPVVVASEKLLAAGLGVATHEEAALTGKKLAPFMAKGRSGVLSQALVPQPRSTDRYSALTPYP